MKKLLGLMLALLLVLAPFKASALGFILDEEPIVVYEDEDDEEYDEDEDYDED